jgi:ribonuclease HII
VSSPPLNRSRCLAGVDEAGLGPILGPLVVAGVAMEGPAGLDPWRALRGTVARKKPSDGRFHVADSKKVKQGSKGHLHLERTALCFFGAWAGGLPATIADLLARCGVDHDAFRACPWYGDLQRALPVWNDRDDLELRTHLLRRSLDEREIRLTHVAICPVEVAEFNGLIARTDNKSDTHFEAYSRVLLEIVSRLRGDAHLVADRCGGRMHYRDKLRRAMPGARVDVVRETVLTSAYRIRAGDADIRLMFATEGEERAFPTALSSCLAKYVRELLMTVLNDWFVERVPGLEPTAGYFTDGKRFLADIEDYVVAQRLSKELLVRLR